MPPNTYIRAVVQKVIPKGAHGPFAVATSDQMEGSVTFSLEPTVWEEDEWPEEGTVVLLDNLRKKRAGWRAKKGRFWKLSDEQIERSSPVEFLYPISRQYPFDEVCERIVRALEERNWEVPGMAVELDDYGSGDQRFRLVRYIKGRDFRIHFGRAQRRMPGGHYNDTAAVSDITIPMKELCVYEDETGPTFYLYVGVAWERDRKKFMDGLKVNSKLNGKRRMYLMYKGAFHIDQCSYPASRHPQRRTYLVHTNDLGREYNPEGDEPRFFVTSEVLEEFRQYLEQTVLAAIMSHPIPEEKIDTLATPGPIAFPASIGPLFCFGDYREAEQIKQGRADPKKLEPADRYGLSGSGYRLMSLGTPNDGTVPEIAYKGFLWCAIGEVTAETEIDSLKVPGHHRWSDRERFVIRVKPNRANGIYIADHAPYEKRRKELADATPGRDRFTDEEVADFTRTRARTIIPITEYKGEFEQPLVLICRELSFDEVKVVSGPHERR